MRGSLPRAVAVAYRAPLVRIGVRRGPFMLSSWVYRSRPLASNDA